MAEPALLAQVPYAHPPMLTCADNKTPASLVFAHEIVHAEHPDWSEAQTEAADDRRVRAVRFETWRVEHLAGSVAIP